MYAGAAVSAMPLIIALPSIGDVNTDVARRAPGGLPDRAGTLLVTVVTPDPM